ncbi:MAG: 23S rRNA (guanosine(2251)-2'-O)-methyltransferase RlmB [Candidatus Melainabacteria bacterium RIFCSPLOWO2_02_FULL_35_15]|nr:MAG: 23S rRNA (guanosine(2251)-2'-O)-methyltransferase RlmB [Candidatus Melainabacteria bacterium RIFCSPLOWO2_12_FULL_35_11]OGI12937.1 MAG: 23S rRNA (guanosine(2251)-2'-O)-methyltransferase RlmB [Candidatus Melainabacteria bacterium RIFCSPLOWO2_02_FULL_35_15]
MIKNKKENNFTSCELVSGKNPVLEVIKNSTLQVNKIWLSENLRDQNIKQRITSYAKEKKIPFYTVPEQKISSLAKNHNHQGMVLSISPVKYLPVKEIVEKSKIILVAHEIEDPHNIGAMIRTFVAGGGNGVILSGRKSAGINSTTIKTSAGALFHANFARVANCVNVINELKKNNFWIVGTDSSAASKSIYDIDFPEQVAIIVGNEHEGLGKLIKKNCDFLARIPVSDKVDSLNVSVAFGIVLFEILRRRIS